MSLFDIKSWLVILVVVILVFGTKKLKNLGSDLGSGIKSFKKALNEEDNDSDIKENITQIDQTTKPDK